MVRCVQADSLLALLNSSLTARGFCTGHNHYSLPTPVVLPQGCYDDDGDGRKLGDRSGNQLARNAQVSDRAVPIDSVTVKVAV